MKFDLFADHVAPLEEVAGANEVCFLIVLLMFPMFTPFQGRENFDFSSLKTAFGSLPRRKHKKDNIFSPIFQGDGGGQAGFHHRRQNFFCKIMSQAHCAICVFVLIVRGSCAVLQDGSQGTGPLRTALQ